MSSKVVEANAGIHSLAMAVAVRITRLMVLLSSSLTKMFQPVTSWRLYGKISWLLG